MKAGHVIVYYHKKLAYSDLYEHKQSNKTHGEGGMALILKAVSEVGVLGFRSIGRLENRSVDCMESYRAILLHFVHQRRQVSSRR